MSPAAERYRQLLQSLREARAAADGALAQAVESRFIRQLDDCWKRMTEAEQDAAEAWLRELSSRAAARA